MSPGDSADQSRGDRLERLYDALIEDDESRVCGDLPESACRELPRSFALYVGSLVLTKLGDALASVKTTLTWVMSALGAPSALVALLVPIRESGSMLPQIFTSAPIRRLPVRKWVWVAGSLLQALAIAAIGGVAFVLEGAAAGWAILAAVALFSLARSLASVASKDVKGKTIPKTRRGRAGGLAASLSGVLVLAAGLGLLALRREEVAVTFYGWLLLAASGLWILAAALFSRIEEHAGETDDGDGGLRQVLGRLSLLASDAPFRRFVLTRALCISTALAAPYYVLLARERAGGGLSLLALFVLVSGLASSLSSFFWGRWADRSSRRVLIAAVTLASALGLAVFAWIELWPVAVDQAWTYVAAYFVLGVAHSGVRLGRKTYVVDLAAGNRRTDYVAVSNTLIGALLLLSGALGALVDHVGPAGMLAVLAVPGFAGALLGLGLPEVETS